MADVITAVSSGLVQLLEDAGASDVRRLGNGVDYELFNRAAAGEAPRDIAELAKPVIGYVGAIGDWFDFGLVERLAAAFPSGSIALVGPVYRGVRGRAERMTHGDGKVVLLGPKPYESLGGYIAAMDVCIVPLVRSGFRRAADPNKLYEYASLGKPVVTFAFSEDIAALGEQFYLARDEDSFIAQVQAALERGADEERLRTFARQHSWQAIADEMVGLIEEGRKRQHA
jgi:glycosyltransferase involved in cell wall biosynthesis